MHGNLTEAELEETKVSTVFVFACEEFPSLPFKCKQNIRKKTSSHQFASLKHNTMKARLLP